MSTPTAKNFDTGDRVAKRLGVPIKWLCRQADAGKVPSLDIGNGRRLFDIDDVRAALKSLAASDRSREDGEQ